jgi:hypothetical protein
MTAIRRYSLLCLVIVATTSCQPSRTDTTATTSLADIAQTGDDLYATFRIRQEWIAKESLVTVRLPAGESLQVHLNPVMHHGSTLRFHGKGVTTSGALFLTIDTVP